MEIVILSLAVFSIVVGLIGLVYSITELVRSRNYVPPKRKRRSTYIKP